MNYSESKQKKIDAFDVNGIGAANGNLFGLPFNFEESELIILPVPWEVTVSYHAGTANAPGAILDASVQVDLFDTDMHDAWKRGIYMLKISDEWKQKNNYLRKKASEYIRLLGLNKAGGAKNILEEINSVCDVLRKWIFEQTIHIQSQNKLIALVGGDHSTPLGFMQAIAQKNTEFGVLHIDAHADVREAYEGFIYSHASIFFNALQIPEIKKIVQVGLRDVCQAEMDMIHANNKLKPFFYHDMQNEIFAGNTWKNICDEIVNELPPQVYISFDIDALDRKLCPNTGTPVPGGFEYEQIIYLLNAVVNSGKKIIGFDMVEVSPGPDEWDANVGARLLYKLSNLTLKSNGK